MQAQTIPQPKPGPAPTVKVGKPVTFELPNGLKVLVVENHKLPTVSFSLTIDNMPYAEGNKKGVASLLGSMMGNGTSKMSKEAYNEEIDFLGANVNIGASGASASCLSKYSGRILQLLAEGALTPKFTQEDFDSEKKKMIENLKSDEKSVKSAAGRVGRALPFGKNHPFGEFVTEATLNNVSLADVKENYATYFVPGNAYLVVVGDVKTADVKAMVQKQFGNWTKATAPSVTYPDPLNVQYSQINFVDMPNAVQSDISAINLVNLKMTDPDYFAAIIANQILGGSFGYLDMNIREKHGWTYGAHSSIRGSKYISSFDAGTQVRNTVTDSTVVEMLNEIKRIRTEKVTEEELNKAKALYIGNFVMGVQKPATVAGFALRTRTQNLPADFYENYVKNISAVTAEDVMKAASKYFIQDNMRWVIVGKGSEVVPALEKLKMPIMYFDKYANPAQKPALSKPVPAGINTKSVLDNYINAIGGEKAAKKVKTISMTGTTQIPGAPAPLTFTSKKDVKGRLVTEFKMGEMSLMKQMVNDKEGYVAQQGQKKEVTGEDLKEMRQGATTFEELQMVNNPAVTVTAVEPINGEDAYAVKNGDVTSYYNVKSGLKVAEAVSKEMGGKKNTMMTYFKDYKDVKGIKYPFTIVQQMGPGMELNVAINEIKINEGVSDADFK